jgi:hypothetical protein
MSLLVDLHQAPGPIRFEVRDETVGFDVVRCITCETLYHL